MNRLRSAVVLLLVSLGLVGLAAPSVAATARDGVSVEGTVNGRDLDRIDAGDPVPLSPDEGVELRVEVRNDTGEELQVRSIRFDARVVGLLFFTYTTRVDLVVPPGGTGERAFIVDVGDLGGQARGLLPAQLALLDPDRDVVASRDVAVDVDGSFRSVYAVFGLAVLALTGLILGGLLLRLSRGTLPPHRWQRAAAFVAPGIGAGLTLTFSLSTLRLVLPSTALWVPLVAGGAAAGLVAGWLTPSPDVDMDDEDDLDGAPAGGDDDADLARFTVPQQPPRTVDLTGAPQPTTTPEG
ncbi:MAG TPA: hypothetical protein VNU26_07410 [Mycobacteriales bacterium]|nr:hypothetical protein [Mycobacteriales bacterium]